MSRETEVQRYRILLATARSLGRAMDLPALIAEILSSSRSVMHAEACSVFLPDPDAEELVLYSTDARVSSLDEPPRIPKGAGIAGAVFASRRCENVRDVQSDPRHHTDVERKIDFVTRSMITVPLLNGAECVGVMQALNPVGREAFDDQDQEILEAFASLIVSALLRLDAQRREMEQVRSRQELLLAREIQESFLPQSRSFPYCQIGSRYFPARAVGGDFYFIHPAPDNRLLLGLGDVSGKGVPASLTMARATATIKAMVGQLESDLGAWLTALNRQMTQDLRAGRFIGVTLLLVDPAASSIQICAAGQFSPARFDRSGWRLYPARNHLPLGIFPEVNYSAERAPLKPGESWLLFSDGIPDARNSKSEDFTLERFIRALPAEGAVEPALDAAIGAWRGFADPGVQHDDVSLLLLNWRGLPPPVELRTRCCPENLKEGRDFVEQWAAFAGFDDVAAGQMVAGACEAATNVFCHAYHRQPGPLIYRAEIEAETGCFVLQIFDNAPATPRPTIQGRDLDDLRPGGLGAHIIAQAFDEADYRAWEKGTRLVLRKRLPDQHGGIGSEGAARE